MAADRPPPVIIAAPDASAAAPATLIILHGYHDTPAEFIPRVFLPAGVHGDARLQHVRLVVPAGDVSSHHPVVGKPVWYDMPQPWPVAGIQPGSQPGFAPNLAQVQASLDYLEDLLRAEEQRGTPPERVVLMGYSQSGGLAVLFMMLRARGRRLAGVVSLSSFPVTVDGAVSELLAAEVAAGRQVARDDQGVPLLLVHGRRDKFVPLSSHEDWKKSMEARLAAKQGPSSVDEAVVEMGHVPRPCFWEPVRSWMADIIPQADAVTAKL